MVAGMADVVKLNHVVESEVPDGTELEVGLMPTEA